MSSSSEFEPDESDFDSDHAPRRAPRKSTSRSQSAARPVSASVSVSAEPEDVEHNSEYLNAIVTDRRDALKKSFKLHPKSLAAYEDLLAEVEKDYDPKNTKDEDGLLLNVTQDAGVVWTAAEKETLYNVLDRRGFDGIKQIATAIGSKSELEVMEHLRLVRQTLKQHLEDRHFKYITVAEIPAAIEVNEECCAEQQKYADYLIRDDQITVSHTNKLQYLDLGIIRESEAQYLNDSSRDVPLPGDLQLATSLFNMPNWISLSRDLLMNFGGKREEDNWENIAQTEEDTPSITGDAIMDFSALAISLTRRLVHSAIFLAESRLRTTYRNTKDTPRLLNLEDVKTAIDVLNLKRKRPSFVHIARKNRTAIGAFRPQRLKPSRILSYVEAERIVEYSDKGFYKAAHDIEHEKGPHGHGDENEHEHEHEHEHEQSEYESNYDELDPMDEDESEEESEEEFEEEPGLVLEAGEDSQPESPQPSASASRISDFDADQLAEDQEEEQADTFDREQSRLEQLKLWQMFEKEPPADLHVPIIPLVPKEEITEDEKEDLAQLGLLERRNPEDLVNWRDRTLYRSEWEQYGSDMEDLAADLAWNTRKRRRLAAGDRDGSDEDGDENKYGNDREVQKRWRRGRARSPNKPPLSAAVVESDDEEGPEPDEVSETRPAVQTHLSAEIVVDSDESGGDDATNEQSQGEEYHTPAATPASTSASTSTPRSTSKRSEIMNLDSDDDDVKPENSKTSATERTVAGSDSDSDSSSESSTSDDRSVPVDMSTSHADAKSDPMDLDESSALPPTGFM